MKRIIINGGTGFIGTNLSIGLSKAGSEIFVITRKAPESLTKPPYITRYISWDNGKLNDLNQYLDIPYVFVNLAGASLDAKRWTESYKKEMYESRVHSTKLIVDFINKAEKKPETFINASAIGFYGSSGVTILYENSPKGTGFIADLCNDWEIEANKASSVIRVVTPRIGVVLDKNHGALKKMILPYKFFVGGTIGSGKQWFSWIHIADIVNLFEFVINNNKISGPVNFVSPQPVTMEDLAKEIGKTLRRPSFLKVPEFALKIILGEMASTVLGSQRVLPDIALKNGFKFKFDNISLAIKDLLN